MHSTGSWRVLQKPDAQIQLPFDLVLPHIIICVRGQFIHLTPIPQSNVANISGYIESEIPSLTFGPLYPLVYILRIRRQLSQHPCHVNERIQSSDRIFRHAPRLLNEPRNILPNILEGGLIF